MVSEYFADVGIKADVKMVDWAVYDKNLKDSNYTMSINWSLVATNPILAYQDYYSTSRIGKTWHAGHGIHTPEIDKLIDSFGETADAVNRKKFFRSCRNLQRSKCHLFRCSQIRPGSSTVRRRLPAGLMLSTHMFSRSGITAVSA